MVPQSNCSYPPPVVYSDVKSYTQLIQEQLSDNSDINFKESLAIWDMEVSEAEVITSQALKSL